MFNPEGCIVFSLLIQNASRLVGSAGSVLSIKTISQSLINPIMSITQEMLMEKHLCIGLVINCLFVASFIIIPTVPKFICCFANILFFTDFTGKKINHTFRVAIQPMVHFVLFTIC
jgi:hypothetical protein